MALDRQSDKGCDMTRAEARRAWIAALRSGEFRQVDGRLSDGKSHCCLGVACEVAIRHGINLDRQLHTREGDTVVYYETCDESLPEMVRDWLGLTTDMGTYEDRQELREYDLASLNDGGASFEEIARVIEAEPKGLVND